MKPLQMIIMALSFTGLFGTQVYAHDRFDNTPYSGYVDGGSWGYSNSYREAGMERHDRDRYRHGYRSGTVCRETVEVVRGRHGRYHEVVRTVCRDRDYWHRPHRHEHYSNDRFERDRRW